MQKLNFWLLAILVFTFAVGFYYLVFGLMFSGFLAPFWDFFSCPKNEFILEIPNFLGIVKDSFPFTMFVLSDYVFGASIFSILLGIFFFVVGIGFLKRKKFAKISLCAFFIFEFFFGFSFLFDGDVLGFLIHCTSAGAVVLYLLLSKKSRDYFEKNLF